MSDHEFAECAKALAKVYEFLDAEIGEAEADEIREHLTACEPCLDHYEVETALRALVKRCCGGQRAPEALRIRVQTQITHTVVYRTPKG